MAPTSTLSGLESAGQLAAGRTRARVREAVVAKLGRLKDQARDGVPEPRFVDLFSGCGGISLGFTRAGCRSLGGVESDPEAADTYARNFHSGTSEELKLHARQRDITKEDPEALLREWGHANPLLSVDFIVGGPPCPAYSRIGRAKLREIARHPAAHRRDPRAKLYVPYLKFVEATAPIAVVMENVPEILNFGGHNLAEEISDALAALGYRCAYTLLNAANYGVPQTRERFFLLGIHEVAEVVPTFPAASHSVVLPFGYRGTRSHALSAVKAASSSRYVDCTPPARLPRKAITAAQAIADLPPLIPGNTGVFNARKRDDRVVRYSKRGRPNKYVELMRGWPGFKADGQVDNHLTRQLTERDYRVFRRMKPGADYPAAVKIAWRLFRRELARIARKGMPADSQSYSYRVTKPEFIPPYDVKKFPNKWRKMEADAPARTLMAHLGKDAYSHIHFDSGQARTISVREAARLQSFPDGFRFPDRLNPAFRQIGNSVPPLMAHAIAAHLVQVLGLGSRRLHLADR